VKPFIAKAMSRGIKVSTRNLDTPDTQWIFYVFAADYVEIGTYIMGALAKYIGFKGKVGIWYNVRWAGRAKPQSAYLRC